MDQPFETFGPYTTFPFDVHDIVMRASLPSSDIFNCSSSFFSAHSVLLPSTDEWAFHGDESVTLSHPTDANTGQPIYDQCELRIKVVRRAFVFMVKQLFISIVVAYGGILSLYMHPAEHTGDRGALVVVSALIIITAMQTDKGLGTLTCLSWNRTGGHRPPTPPLTMRATSLCGHESRPWIWAGDSAYVLILV